MFIPVRYTIYSWSPPELSLDEKHWLGGEIERVGKRSFTLALKRKITQPGRNETDSFTYNDIIRNVETLNVAERANVSLSDKILFAIIVSIFAILVAAIPMRLKITMLIAIVAIVPITFGSLYFVYRDIDRWTQQLIDEHAAAIGTLGSKSHNSIQENPRSPVGRQQVFDSVGNALFEPNTEAKLIPGDALEMVDALFRLLKSGTAFELIDQEGARWVNEFLHYAAHPLAPPELKAEASAVRRYVGTVDGLPLTRAQTRTFTARFETYLFENTAPNAQLARVFGQLKSWLATVYLIREESKAPISDHIRDWYARVVSVDCGAPVLVLDRPRVGDEKAA